MFFESVKAAWHAGNVRVGLSAEGYGKCVWVEGKGLVAFKIPFLNRVERQMLADLSKQEATFIAGLPWSVDDWTPEQRVLIHESIMKDGLPRCGASWTEQEASTPQRRLLAWQAQRLKITSGDRSDHVASCNSPVGKTEIHLVIAVQALEAIAPIAPELFQARKIGMEVVVPSEVEAVYVAKHGEEGRKTLRFLRGEITL